MISCLKAGYEYGLNEEREKSKILLEALKDITTYDCGSDGFAAPTMESNYKSQKAREALAQIEKMRG